MKIDWVTESTEPVREPPNNFDMPRSCPVFDVWVPSTVQLAVFSKFSIEENKETALSLSSLTRPQPLPSNLDNIFSQVADLAERFSVFYFTVLQDDFNSHNSFSLLRVTSSNLDTFVNTFLI